MQPDAVVLDLQRIALVDLLNGQDLSLFPFFIFFSELEWYYNLRPGCGFVRGEQQPHLVELGGPVFISGQVMPDHFVFFKFTTRLHGGSEQEKRKKSRVLT